MRNLPYFHVQIFRIQRSRHSINLVSVMFKQRFSLPKYWRRDFPASIVVFLLALPLNLGVAMASGVPMFAGLITGVIGGVVVGSISKSSLNITGPAASMAVIVLSVVNTLPSFEAFLLALVLTGVLQVLFGVFRAGVISNYLPASVVTGMLSAIGISIIINQLPHAVGFDRDFVGNVASVHFNENILAKMYWWLTGGMTLEAVVVFLGCMGILLVWSRKKIVKLGVLRYVPPSLLAIFFGIMVHLLFKWWFPTIAFSAEHLVRVPISSSIGDFFGNFDLPDFQYWSYAGVWASAFSMAIIASIQALLGIEGTDKLDPLRRTSPPNRELIAQGIGNIAAGMLGGILLTSVIVRSLANVNAGARTSASVIFQGVLMFVCILTIPHLLNQIPLAALAAVLISVGFQLVKPSVFVASFKKGGAYFIPFIVTVVTILIMDLLIGVCTGLIVASVFTIQNALHPFLSVAQWEGNYVIRFEKNLTFIQRYELCSELQQVPKSIKLTLDFSRITFIDAENKAVLQSFIQEAPKRCIEINFHPTVNTFEVL